MVKIKTSKLNIAISKIIDSGVRALLKAERICGSADALAKKIGVNEKCYGYWRRGETFLPYEVAMQIYVITGGKVSIHDLRSDLKSLTNQYINSLKNKSKANDSPRARGSIEEERPRKRGN